MTSPIDILLDILPFQSDNFYTSLGNTHCTSAEVKGNSIAKYLFGYASEIGTKTIIIENQYTDGDYLDDFSSYYVKCFKPYDRKCKRIHLFSAEITRQQFLKIIRREAVKEEEDQLRASYLGFIVARPLPEAIIGRTVLKTYESDGGRRNYSCTKSYHANLFGIDLSVESLAYQEQDNVLAACATVSLWCAFHMTSELFGTPAPTPAVITRAANQVLHQSRPIPSRGLNVQQICHAIRHVGLEPEMVEVKASTPLVSLIYGHLKMGLPVILIAEVEGLGHHGITIAGYSQKTQQVIKQEVAPRENFIPMVGLRIDEFYAHDDQIGPFSRLKVEPSRSGSSFSRVFPVVFGGSWKDEFGKYRAMYPLALVIPVYNKIRVRFLDIQVWLYRVNELLAPVFQSINSQASLEWDVHLITSNDYKMAIRSDETLAGDSLERVLITEHPRFIWRAALRVDDQEILELLADATGMARSFPIYLANWQQNQYKLVVKSLLETSSLQDFLIQKMKRPMFDFLKQSVQS